MSKITCFQRYSSIENTVTNNTLQLLARIYDYSTAAASRFLTDVTGQPIDIGIEIVQQERVGNAVPDGAIIQRSFKILIEAKVDSLLNTEQLLRHAATFSCESQKILLLLTKQSIGIAEDEISALIPATHPDVVFKSVTYETIRSATRGLFKEHEVTMAALVEDYIEYCNDVRLFDQSKYLLRIVPCGQSIDINKKHGIYFHPSDRGYTPHAFVGIYAHKAVQAIIAVESVFDINLTNGHLERTLVDGDNTDKFDNHLRDIIKDAKDVCGYEIASRHRFFCGVVSDTDFCKSSAGGIQGARFVNLRELLGNFTGLNDIAQRLRDIGSTKTLAKLANHLAKKRPAFAGGVDLNTIENLDTLLDTVEVGNIWGIGRRLSASLEKQGIRTARQLRCTSGASLRQQFGVVMERLVLELNGIQCVDLEEIRPTKKGLTASRSFGRYITTLNEMEQAVTEYASRAAEKLRHERSVVQTISVFIETNTFRPDKPQHLRNASVRIANPTDDTCVIVNAALRALQEILTCPLELVR